MAIKLDSLKKKLYFTRLNILFNKGLKEGKITKFDEEIFDKMSNTIIASLPVSLYIKYSNHLFAQGTCYDRSLYMFLALDDALLVRGYNKDLEYNYGKGHEGHGWIEIGDLVYDPSLMLIFDKDTYYSIYGCSNVSKTDKKTYLSKHKEFVDFHVSHNFDEFRPGGKRRLDLGILIIQLKALSEMLGNEQFTKDFNDYLSFIEYDEKQISEERQKVIQRMLADESAMSVISGNRK